MPVARCLFLASLLIAALTLLAACVGGPARRVQAVRDSCVIELTRGGQHQRIVVHSAAPVCSR